MSSRPARGTQGLVPIPEFNNSPAGTPLQVTKPPAPPTNNEPTNNEVRTKDQPDPSYTGKMQILPGPDPLSVTLKPHAFSPQIIVNGLAQEALCSLIAGGTVGRESWRPGVELTAALADADENDAGPVQEFALDDGLALLRSGGSGRVRVQTGHTLGHTLLPTSLHLLLAHQWARGGLMLVHAAAFEFGGVGVLALGDRGAGKSVLSAAVLAAGGRVVSDDWVMVGKAENGGFHAERLRDFLMFRSGPPLRALLEQLGDLPTTEDPDRSKLVARIPGASDDRFPHSTPVDRIWLLQRCAGERPAETRAKEASPIAALQGLMQATTPVLLSKRMPAERDQLRRSTGDLLQSVPIQHTRTGVDIATTSETTLGRVIA